VEKLLLRLVAQRATRTGKLKKGRVDFLILYLLLGSKLSLLCVSLRAKYRMKGMRLLWVLVVQKGITLKDLEARRIGFGKLLCLRFSLDRLSCKVRRSVKAARIVCAKGDGCRGTSRRAYWSHTFSASPLHSYHCLLTRSCGSMRALRQGSQQEIGGKAAVGTHCAECKHSGGMKESCSFTSSQGAFQFGVFVVTG
jgi:hypothetical protein